MLTQLAVALLLVGVALWLLIMISRRTSGRDGELPSTTSPGAPRGPAADVTLIADETIVQPSLNAGSGIENMLRVLEDMRRSGIDDETIQRYESLIERARDVVAIDATGWPDEDLDDDAEPLGLGTSDVDLPSEIDPAYGDIPEEKIPAYQAYVAECLEAVDIDNFTRLTMGKQVDESRMSADNAILENIIVGRAKRDGMSPAVLQVMVWQYFAADVIQREIDRHCWVDRVMRPNRDVNYFPSPHAVRRTFLEEG